MTLEQQGAYRNLLDHAWQMDPPCTLPDDERSLAMLSGLGDRWGTEGPVILRWFTPRRGRLVNKKLYSVWREMYERREQKSRAGKLGGEKSAEIRWNRGKQRLSSGQAKSNPSVSVSTSVSEEKKNTSFDAWFDQEFLPAYPENRRVQVRTARAEARKLKLNPDQRREVLERLRRCVASDEWTKDGGQWIPGAGKFFADGWWQREPTTIKPGGLEQRPANIIARRSCGCETVLSPEGRKEIPCGRHQEQAVRDIRAAGIHG